MNDYVSGYGWKNQTTGKQPGTPGQIEMSFMLNSKQESNFPPKKYSLGDINIVHVLIINFNMQL